MSIDIDKIAKMTSWFACLITLVVGFISIPMGVGELRGSIVVAIAIFHYFSMLKNDWGKALRITGWELIAFIGIVLVYLYPTPEDPHAVIPFKFEYAFWIWLISVAILFPLAAICFRLADKIKREKNK